MRFFFSTSRNIYSAQFAQLLGTTRHPNRIWEPWALSALWAQTTTEACKIQMLQEPYLRGLSSKACKIHVPHVPYLHNLSSKCNSSTTHKPTPSATSAELALGGSGRSSATLCECRLGAAVPAARAATNALLSPSTRNLGWSVRGFREMGDAAKKS